MCTYKYYVGVGWTPIGSYGWNDGCYAWSHDCIGLSRSNGKNNVFFIPCYNVDPYIYDSKRSKWKDYCIYRNPLAPVALMGFIFFVFNQIGPVFAGTDSAEQNHSEHKESDNSLLIKANEYDFLPNSINVDVGETVTLSVENTGTVEH